MLKSDAHTPYRQGQLGSGTLSDCELTRMAHAIDAKPQSQADGYLIRCLCHDDRTTLPGCTFVAAP
jgi:hypothetical protein